MALSEASKAAIKEIAAKVRAELEGGTLYGERIDMSDPDALLAAAYLFGVDEERRRKETRYFAGAWKL